MRYEYCAVAMLARERAVETSFVLCCNTSGSSNDDGDSGGISHNNRKINDNSASTVK